VIDAVELISEWPAALGSLARLLGVPVHALAHTNDLDLIGLDLGAVNVVSSVPASAAPPVSGLGGSGALRRDDTRVDLSAGLLSAVMALLLLNNGMSRYGNSPSIPAFLIRQLSVDPPS